MSTRFQVLIVGLLVAIMLTFVAVLALRSATHVDTTNRVTLSADGVEWTAELEDAFFFSDTAWSPGQTRSAIFWVRNDADVDADVDVVVTTSAGEALTQSGQVTLSAALGDGGDFRFFVPGRGVNTMSVGTLSPGERETVTFRAEHTGDAELDSSLLRHRISGSGTRADDASPTLHLSDARLELAPLFLCVGLLVVLVVIRRRRVPPRTE